MTSQWFSVRNFSVINGIPVKQQPSILCRIVTTVIGQSQTIPFLSDIRKDSPRIMLTSVAFRICMANVLIRAAQKVTLKHRAFFVSCVVSPVLHFLEVSEFISLLQLFSAVCICDHVIICWVVYTIRCWRRDKWSYLFQSYSWSQAFWDNDIGFLLKLAHN